MQCLAIPVHLHVVQGGLAHNVVAPAEGHVAPGAGGHLPEDDGLVSTARNLQNASCFISLLQLNDTKMIILIL